MKKKKTHKTRIPWQWTLQKACLGSQGWWLPVGSQNRDRISHILLVPWKRCWCFPYPVCFLWFPSFYVSWDLGLGPLQFLEGPYQLCILVSLQLRRLWVLCLCWTRLVFTMATEKMLREVAVWGFQHSHVDLIKASLLLCSLSGTVALWSIQVPTPETWEASLTFPSLPSSGQAPVSPSETFLTMTHSNKCILPCNPEHTHASDTKVL